MKPGFEPGIVREFEVEVTEDMCPGFDGVPVHRVYSTWSMVEHMEKAARRVLEGYLEDHEEGIGARVAVDHRSPAPVGSKVRVRAELIQARHKVCVCKVTAWVGNRLIGEGEQVQVIWPKERIEAMIEAAKGE